jgi:hypothetical protein
MLYHVKALADIQDPNTRFQYFLFIAGIANCVVASSVQEAFLAAAAGADHVNEKNVWKEFSNDVNPKAGFVL